MKISVFLVFLISLPFFAQTVVSGTVTDSNGVPIIGANAYLEGTYDGGSSDENGRFSFTTDETGIHTLVVSYVSFEAFKLTANVSQMKEVKIVLREDINSLETVTLSAGTFSAGDNSKISALKPLDIVTTASAVGDFVGALQTLPGTSTVAEDGRLFVRGGDAGETQVFIDGLRVYSPYSPTTNNTPTRGRYSPFLFDGITFSTGGYSAEFGQALSSVLLLNTIDEPSRDKTDISIMSVGAGVGHTKKWNSLAPRLEEGSLSLNASYTNLAPYIALLPDRNEWKKPYESSSGEAVFRQKLGDGLLKVYGAFDATHFALIQEDINAQEGMYFKLKDNNFYSNASFSEILNAGWSILAGGSYSHATTKVGMGPADIHDTENSAHLKLKLGKRFSKHLSLNFGTAYLKEHFNEKYRDAAVLAHIGFDSNLYSVFSEADILFSRKMAIKLGMRGEYGSLSKNTTVAPRASFAYKTGKNGQLSLAYGDFYQHADKQVLKFDSNLAAEHAEHYILNYQYAANNRIFRAELYRKTYSNLVTFGDSLAGISTEFRNDGGGYAQGLDIFWRDNNSIKNTDYWISYSYLDTERKYQNFPRAATPSFANTHNISVVGKYWIEDWKSQVGFSYQFASGRPYTDYNTPGFLQKKTKSYNSVSLNWAYLLSSQKILYASINNVFAFRNVNGYQYAQVPDTNGHFARRQLRPAADQFFFVGFFWTISADKKDNQLKNL